MRSDTLVKVVGQTDISESVAHTTWTAALVHHSGQRTTLCRGAYPARRDEPGVCCRWRPTSAEPGWFNNTFDARCVLIIGAGQDLPCPVEAVSVTARPGSHPLVGRSPRLILAGLGLHIVPVGIAHSTAQLVKRHMLMATMLLDLVGVPAPLTRRRGRRIGIKRNWLRHLTVTTLASLKFTHTALLPPQCWRQRLL
jgi:hypothetical protein